jgi:transcription elongation factor GreA
MGQKARRLASAGSGGPFHPGAGVATIERVTTEHHLSQTAYDRLKTEHDELVSVGRIEIARKIQAARELGDLKENGDYHAAKEEQGKMEGRIIHLASLIENAVIIESSGAGGVSAGCVVAIAYEGDDEVERYLLGSIEERHDDLDVISPGSPLGSALMGRAVGDVVGYEAPGGELKVRIVEIEA